MTDHVVFWNPGDRTEAVCPTCRDVTAATFRLRNVELSNVIVDDVLTLVCDVCDTIVEIPHQSTARLNQAREAQEILRARVNRKLVDALETIAANFGVTGEALSAPLLRYYTSELIRQPDLGIRMRTLLEDTLTQGRQTERVEFRLRAAMKSDALRAASRAGIAKETDLVRALVAMAVDDLLRRRDPERQQAARLVADTVCV